MFEEEVDQKQSVAQGPDSEVPSGRETEQDTAKLSAVLLARSSRAPGGQVQRTTVQLEQDPHIEIWSDRTLALHGLNQVQFPESPRLPRVISE